jgi:hypothetical protein
MSAKLHPAISWLAWATACVAILNLGLIPGNFGESLCGPWG